MKKYNIKYILLSVILIFSFLTTNLTPLETVAEGEMKDVNVNKPRAKVGQRTLYEGYEGYGIKMINVTKDAKIKYSSSNEKVAKVSETGYIQPVKAGDAKITIETQQNNSKYQSVIYVKVEKPYITILNKITEIKRGCEYNFIGVTYGLAKPELIWSSSNPKVAEIDKKTGVMKTKANGEVEITFKETRTGKSEHVNIAVYDKSDCQSFKSLKSNSSPNSEKAVFLSGLDLRGKKGKYYTTKKDEYIKTSRFVLYLQKGIDVPVDVIELIDYFMNQIEEQTKYKFYTHKSSSGSSEIRDKEFEKNFTDAKKLKKVNKDLQLIDIIVANHDDYVDAYSSSSGYVVLMPDHLKFYDSERNYVIIHELLHVIFFQNGASMEQAFNEGFAEYYTDKIIKNNKKVNFTFNVNDNLKDYRYIIDKDTFEDFYVNTSAGQEMYKLGLRLMKFISERYGSDALRRVHDKVSRASVTGNPPNLKTIAEVLKRELSKDFFAEFSRWHKANMERFGDKDLLKAGDFYIDYNTLIKYFGFDEKVNIPNTVNFIQPEAFNANINLVSVNIPETVLSVGGGAFYGCENLKYVKLPHGITKIYECTFENCSSLTSINLPEGITEVSVRAFLHCTSLKKITLPEGVKEIGSNAFQECSSLSYIYIPPSVTRIRDYAFYDSPKLVIYGKKGSYAENYAKKQGIAFRVKS